MLSSHATLIIKGITNAGKKFRPSDWAERMCGKFSTYRNRRLHYSDQLHPAIRDGIKCIAVDENLKTANPELYKYLLDFATKNNLSICKE